jgi:cell division protein FtsI (penicillin-binding protein 3)
MNGFFSKIRLWIFGVPLVVFIIIILSRYGKLAFTPEQELIPKIPTVERGAILDRNGKQLAVQTNFYHFGVTPAAVTDPVSFAQSVSGILGMTPQEIEARITTAENSSFAYIKKKIPQETYEELKAVTDAKKYNFVRYDRIPGRVYPENALASQLIGYMGDDGTGLAGIEYSMQNILSPVQKPDELKTIDGSNVYLTIDANLQYKLEKIAHESLEKTQAADIMILAANAKNGEILSYISLPSVNLNSYSQATKDEIFDRPAMEAYEPGSVFKIFTVATFLDTGSITTDETWVCDGRYDLRAPGEHIVIKCLGKHGRVDARAALKYSCNDALCQMSENIDAETFLAKLRALGFGQRTGVELPGETAGYLKDTTDKLWSLRSKPTIAIGQEVSVSALQMVQAATALTDGGVPVKLSLISRITTKDGKETWSHKPEYKQRVFKKSTADYLLSCMETVAQSGTGYRAAISDVKIGVKTGTAQMADQNTGGYSDTNFLSNCIAVFPVEDPEIILYIVIEKAKGETYAGRIVAPIIADAANVIIDHLGLSRGGATSVAHSGRIFINNSAPLVVGQILPDFTGMSKRELLPLLERQDIQVHINGTGWVTSQTPAPGTTVTENMRIELNLE